MAIHPGRFYQDLTGCLHEMLVPAGAPVSIITGPHPHGQLSQIPLPAPAAPQDKPNTGLPHTAPPVGVPPPTSEASLPGLSEAMMRVPFGVPPGMHPQGK